MLFPLLLLPFTLVFAAAPKPAPQYTCCRNPGWPVTVLNFEYSFWHPDYSIYHGLKWSGWSNYNFHPGYSTGWSPIPSNYTTLLSKTGAQKHVLEINGGSEKLEDVFSLWFNYHEYTSWPSSAVITFVGWWQGQPWNPIKVVTDTIDDGVWTHVCFNWTDKEGGQKQVPVDRLTIILPDCQKNKCERKWFEIDDVWVRKEWKYL